MKQTIRVFTTVLFALITLVIAEAQSVNWTEDIYAASSNSGNFAIAENNNVFVITASNTITKYDPAGNLITSYTLGSAGSTIHRVVGNSNGNFGIVGTFTAQDFDFGAGNTTPAFNAGGTNWYYATYNVAGALQGVSTFVTSTGFGTAQIADATMLPNGSMFILGDFSGTITYYFNGNVQTSTHNSVGRDLFYVSQMGNNGIVSMMDNQIAQAFATDTLSSPTIAIASRTFFSSSQMTSMTSNSSSLSIGVNPNINSMVITMNISGGLLDYFPIVSSIDHVSLLTDIAFGPQNLILFSGVSNSGGAITNCIGQTITITNTGPSRIIWGALSLITNGGNAYPTGFYYGYTFGNNSSNGGYGIDYKNNMVYLIGGADGVIDYDPGTGVLNQVTYGSGDAVLTKINYNSIANSFSTVSVMSVGGSASESFADFEADSNGNFYVTTSSASTIDIDPSPVTQFAPSGSRIIKYNGATNTINGIVFNDLNSNGIQNTGETAVNGAIVQVNNGTYSFSVNTNANGFYSANVVPGSYTLTCDYSNSGSYSASMPGNIVVNASGSNSTYPNKNFGLVLIPGVQDLSVNLIPLSAVRPGFTASYAIDVHNYGSSAQTATVEMVYFYSSVFSFLSSSVSPSYNSADTLRWTLSNLQPGASSVIYLDFYAQPSAPLGLMMQHSASVNPVSGDNTVADNYSSLTQVTTGSYDPNDKSVSPLAISPSFVSNGEYLNYTIRFQNTGTDTAFTVIIRDTLDNFLQQNTLDITASSHSQVSTMYYNSAIGKHIMEFKFDNILLPDSNINEPGSHGFICYRIKLKPSFTTGDFAYNTADIYFDFNAPVITNTTATSISPVTAGAQISGPLCHDNCNAQINLNPLGGVAPYNYYWEDYVNNAPILGNADLCAGAYVVMITDAVGNVTIDTISIMNPAALISGSTVVNETSFGAGDGSVTVSVTNGTAPYLFSIDGGMNWTSSNVFNNLSSGSFVVCVMDANACTNCDTVAVSFSTGLSTSAAQVFSVYPNPAKDFIKINSLTNGNYALTDAWGNVVLSAEYAGTSMLNLSAFANGIYFLKLSSGKFMQVEKIIIAR